MSITLKTSDRTFLTNPKNWLAHSRYFEKLLSGKWADVQADGSYFIEADSLVFTHILRYLRTGVLPLFYDDAKGHDFALYHSLLQEANYFGIDRLSKWLIEKKYLEAVTIRHLAAVTHDVSDRITTTVSDSNGRTFMHQNPKFVEVDTNGSMQLSLLPITQRRSVFYCPTGKHGRSTETYCRSCIPQAAAERIDISGGWRDADTVTWTVVRKEVKYDHDLCANAYLDA